MNKTSTLSLLLIASGSLLLSACQAMEVQDQAVPQHAVGEPPERPAAERVNQAEPVRMVMDLRKVPSLSDILPELSSKRAVFVGESHTTYSHHLGQLDVIRRLHEMDIDFAIGMEFFQQPFQGPLDEFIAGSISEREMLLKTEYFDRWSYDYRLYRPILKYAYEHGIPLIALNLPKEITRKVADEGMEALSDEQKAQVPADIDDSDAAYRDRMKKIFEQHPHRETQEFERFLQVQLLWDEGMAQCAADYLKANPEKKMVILSGSGHVVYGAGIPRRLDRRLGTKSVTVLPASGMEIEPGLGDFLIFPNKASLPPKGLMGVLLADEEAGVRITGVVPSSAAEKAGIRKDDLIVSLNEKPMGSVAELKIALLDSKPGDKVGVVIRRKRFLFGEKEVPFELELGK